MNLSTVPIDEVKVMVAVKSLVWAVRVPAAAVAAGFTACAVTAVAGIPGILQPAFWLLIHASCLLIGFVIHEGSHVLGLKLTPGITHVTFASTLLRFSVIPMGRLVGWQAALIALAGPLAACVAGVPVALALPDYALHWWFFLHAIFLLPLFGDGRSLVKGLLAWRRQVHLLQVDP
ncbi:hypothetical protein LN996_14785 [Arthrobacter sp. AK01]|uniref:hypothetical protein n=1 Tax=Micrococcaceae TaxID=1268 RepID=UPI001E64C391|nr:MULTISPECIES: hypothetical protein [Micrococcaceae]MCD4852081.1 hypothetical protein [Arthrobacter sp. AK01]MCP1412972.1 hypothetical protein [Paenarthrobacter sp. A20]